MVVPMSDDPVVTKLDTKISQLEAELTHFRSVRSWWIASQSGPARPSTATARPPESGTTVRDWVKNVLGNGAHMGATEIARAALDLGWQTTSKKPPIVMRNNLRLMEGRGEIVRDGSKYMIPRNLYAVTEAEAATEG